ncbi:Deacetylvindoline O-acetyltransferase [Vitis vinifera]|uniref:Deacetylvindoline O-acetyltransferase n=1 Tax=Vitis vinifera TaxID=29760 RepID=A0A438C4D2_VITVI|nr:Deacetylvindoline O-acetyltransferase [Vitis vinifera]
MTRVFPTLKPKLSANFRSSYATRTHATKTILSLCTGRYSRYRPGNPSQYLQVWWDSNWCLLSHKVADALLVVMFANGWVAVARRDTDVLCPRFGLAKLFPPINLSGFNPSTGITKEKIVTRRSVFSASSVASLREKPKKSLHDPAGDEPKYKDGPSIDGELLWEYCPVCDNNTKHGRFPLYEADFGWGKPIWVGSASLPFKNLILFMDSSGTNGGIEAWINLMEEDMGKFQGDKELLSFVSPT